MEATAISVGIIFKTVFFLYIWTYHFKWANSYGSIYVCYNLNRFGGQSGN